MLILTIYCPKCGEKNGEGAKFCKKCGVELDAQDSTKSSVVSDAQGSSIFTSEHKDQSKSRKNIIIIAIVAIICLAAIAGAMLYFNGGLFNDKEPIHIVNTTFSTGHSLDSKTYCTINVGSNHTDENVTVDILYSRDGTDLNDGDKSVKTVDANGDIVCESKDSYDLYPSHAIVTLYDDEGNKLDSADISLNTDDSTQVAVGNGTVTAKSITTAQHSAS